jgi:hypothetical protein
VFDFTAKLGIFVCSCIQKQFFEPGRALRSGLIALSLILASVNHAAVPESAPSDRAAAKLNLYGSVGVESVGSNVRIGASKAEVALTVGSPSQVLSDGQWIFFRDFWVDHSVAHGSLVVGFVGGKVSELTIVTPAKGVALCRMIGRSSSAELISRK